MGCSPSKVSPDSDIKSILKRNLSINEQRTPQSVKHEQRREEILKNGTCPNCKFNLGTFLGLQQESGRLSTKTTLDMVACGTQTLGPQVPQIVMEAVTLVTIAIFPEKKLTFASELTNEKKSLFQK